MADCSTCKSTPSTVVSTNPDVKEIPYIVYESAVFRAEKTAKRLMVTLIVVCVLWFATVALGVWERSQYDYVGEETTQTYSQDGEGTNVIGSNNEVTPWDKN